MKTKIKILIPVHDYDGATSYYRDILGFNLEEKEEDLIYLPTGDTGVALKILNINAEAAPFFPPSDKRFPIFSYFVEKNFLSYCLKLYERGAIFEKAFEYPGGYYTEVSDPAGNKFSIECDNFEEDERPVDTNKMPFFFVY
jgi:predicted enzyme related to lactoylglutathione lyase